MRKALMIFLPAAAILLIDQIFKWSATDYAKNYGTLFGFLDMMWLSVVFAALFLVTFAIAYVRIPENKNMNLGVGILLGGILSNLIDRVLRGFVIDYIRPPRPLGDFNIADVAIWIGGAVILVYLIRHRNEI